MKYVFALIFQRKPGLYISLQKISVSVVDLLGLF